jgi:geranylgeranyl diphosphate synthase type I
MTPLDKLSDVYLQAVEAEMKAVLVLDSPSHALYYGMMHYHLGWLNSNLEPVKVRAGKRIRPLVCLLVCAAAGGEWEQALPAAAAIELLHNFSLIHDDIEDDSPTRRGRDTVWTLWGIPQAINVGDSMFASAYDALARLLDRGVSPEVTALALSRFTQACISLTKGQQLDMWFETQENVSVEQYTGMIAGKTAALVSATTEIGAIVAGAGREKERHYAEYGRNVGLAFQVYDDLLGIWGDERALGKSTASDILTRKKTLPVLYGLAHSPALRELYAQPEIELDRAIALLDETGAREFTQNAAQRYSDNAVAHLNAAEPAGADGDALRALTAELIRRKY